MSTLIRGCSEWVLATGSDDELHHKIREISMCSGSNILDFRVKNGCSGKCMGGSCKNTKVEWVIAASNGKIALFEKENGSIALFNQGDAVIAPSVTEFVTWLQTASLEGRFTQLVLVGDTHDLAWLHHSLPQSLARQVVAEIRYPLVDWFADKTILTGALRQLLGVM